MANKIVRLPDKDGYKQYPLSIIDAIFDKNETSLTLLLNRLTSKIDNTSLKTVLEDGLYICDSNGNILSSFTNSGFNSSIIEDDIFESLKTYLENNGFSGVNDLKMYLKGASQKEFSKKICIIAAGQSNIEGQIPKSEIPSYISALNNTLTNCHYMMNDTKLVPVFNTFVTPDNWAFDTITYYYITQVAMQELYVIKYAQGGTSIDPLGGGNNHWTADYEKLDSLSKSLLLGFENEIRRSIKAYGDNFDIRAFIWHQGEGDFSVADKYYDNLKNVISYIRGVVGNSKLPFITGTISHYSGSYNAVIEAAQKKLASEDPYFWLVDMSAGSLRDVYHFDALSAEYFGKCVYNKLIDAGVINASKIAT